MGLLWCGRESNPRHKDFQSFALPTELPHQRCIIAGAKVKKILYQASLLPKSRFIFDDVNTLAIDIGNTRIKVGEFEDSHLQGVSIVSDMDELTALIAKKKSDYLIFSSVRDHQSELKRTFPDALVLEEGTSLPFENGYSTPQTLGNDRKALMAAAIFRYPGQNVLVIDAGTCITYDLMTESGKYIGGSISPGWKMRLNAMHHFTSKLPLVDPELEELIGDSTKSCMQSGAYHGVLFEIQGTIDAYSKRYTNLTTIITGGDSDVFVRELKNNIFANPDFLLVGLNEILMHAIARS